MDKKSKILIWIFVGLTVLSVGYTFYKTVILQDFVVIDTSEGMADEDVSVESEESEDLDNPVFSEVDASISEEIVEE